MQTRFLFFLLIAVFSSSVSAQNPRERWDLLIDVPTKISIGEPSSQRLQYGTRAITVYSARVLDFTQPQIGLEVRLLRRIASRLRAGIGGGINLSFFELDRLSTPNSYYTHAVVPFYATVGYVHPIGEKTSILFSGKLGYQIHRRGIGGDENGFLFRIKGGVMSGLEASCELMILKNPIRLNVGYEIHQYNNVLRLDWIDIDGTFGLTPEDKIEYSSYARMLQLGIGIRL